MILFQIRAGGERLSPERGGAKLVKTPTHKNVD